MHTVEVPIDPRGGTAPKLISVLAFIAALSGCTAMPSVTPRHPQGQDELSSARHWEAIAADIEMNVDQPVDGSKVPGVQSVIDTGGRCITVRTAANSRNTFQEFLRDSLIRRFVAKGWTVYASTGDDNDSNLAACQTVKINSVAIFHASSKPEPIPGQLTLLTAGVLVVRHIVHEAFRNINVIGTAALAEGAWWASSGLRTNGKIGELAVTVARTSAPSSTGLRQYDAQFTNVYYFKADDISLYQSRKIITPDPAPPEKVGGALPVVAASIAPRIEVSPQKISKCAKSVEFTIKGEALTTDKEDYELGAIPATAFGTKGLQNLVRGPDGQMLQAIHAKFSDVQDANKALDPIPFTVTTLEGVFVAPIAVGGACDKPDTDAAKPTPPASPLAIAPAQGKTADVCKSPFAVVVTGTDAPKAKSASIWKGRWLSDRAVSADGKSVQFTFKKGPTFSKDAYPLNTKELDIDLVLDSKKSVTKPLPVVCGGT